MSGHVTGHRGRDALFRWSGAALVVVSAVAAVAAAVIMASRQHELAATGQRIAGIPVATVGLMRLSPVPDGPAPGFTLTDQDGRTLSLSGFRGKAVVLEFMDSRCTDICPLVSREFIDAYHDLGRTEGRVVFVAVNVDQRYNRVADVLAYSRKHELAGIPDWYFLTGPASSLQAVCRKYDVAVTAGVHGKLVHTASIYFISPHGAEHYIAAPAADYTDGGVAYLPPAQISGWGRGIAQVAEAMLR